MKKQFLALIPLLFIGQSFAMQPMAARTISQLAKYYGKKGFSGMMTALHWEIAAGVPIHEGWKKIRALSNEEESLAGYTYADEKVTTFIASELENAHNIKIDSVRIAPENQEGPMRFPEMGIFANHVLINSTTAKFITEHEDFHYIWRGALAHEAIHQKKNDFHWRAVVDIAMPFITHGSVRIIRNILPIAKKTRTFLGEQLLKIPTAFGKSVITDLSRMSFYKYQEQRADDGVPNEIEKLVGLREYLDALDEHRLKQIKKNYKVSAEHVAENINYTINFLEPHPLPKKRIAKLNQRIELLEKQSEKNVSTSINLDESLVVI